MKKFIVLGLDGAVPGIIEEYVERGLLKNFRRLMDMGTSGVNIPFPSSVTPGNWAAIATGTYPGTNGISDFTVHKPGEPFTQSHNAFYADICNAEFIWESLSKQGEKVATINYPSGRPKRSIGHTSIGDCGMPSENSYEYMISPARLFVAGNLNPVGRYNWNEYEKLQLKECNHWANLPRQYAPIHEGEICIEAKNPDCSGILNVKLLIADKNQQIKVILSTEYDYADKIAEMELLSWSRWIEHDFIQKGKKVKAAFRLRPIVIDEKGSFQLYLSPVYPKTVFAEPAYYSEVLYKELGPYCDILNISKLVMNWLDPQGLMDEFRMQGMWQAKAAVKMLNEYGHTGVLTKWHAFDKFYHFFFDKIDPVSPNFEEEEFEYYENIHLEILKIADDMVGVVLDGMDKDTTLVVISDHGLQASIKSVWVNNFLAEKGYIKTFKDTNGREVIDWNNTRAIMHPYVMIWLNLKGRDPHGCVEMEEYENVRDEIVELLKCWKDPETKKHVFDEVVKTDEAAFYGLWGKRDGDIRIFTRPGYTLYRSNAITKDRCLITPANGEYRGDHGSCRPMANFGRGSEFAFFAAAGYKIRKGYKRQKPVKPCDIIPTICHIKEVKPTKDCEGAVLYDIIHD